MAQTHYTAFTVQNGQVTGTLTDFPVLLRPPNTARFKTTANGGNVASANGYDLRPYTTSGLTGGVALSYQLVPGTYDGANGTFEMWVKVPSLADGSVIYLRYGDTALTTDGSSTATWDTNFKLVTHFGNGTTLNVNDSTSNAINGTNSGSTATTGKISGGVAFNGTSQYIDFGDVLDLGTSNYTISFWMSRTIDGCIIDKAGGAGVTGWGVDFASGAYVRCLLDDSVVSATVFYEVVSPATLHHIAFSVNRAVALGITCYIDGVVKTPDAGGTYDLTTIGSQANAYSLGMGSRHPDNPGTYFGGVLDEVHISFTNRSAAWIGAEYKNQSAPGTFYAIATEDTSGGVAPPPTIGALSPNSASSSTAGPVTLTGVAFTGTGLDGTGGVFTAPAGFTFSSLSIAAGGLSGTVTIQIATAQPAASYTFTYTTSGGTSSGAATTGFTITSVAIVHFGYVNVDAESITLAAAGAFGDLAAQGWTYWATPDSPEGAWFNSSTAAVTATFTLPQALVAGTTYYIFLHMLDYDDGTGNSHRTVYVTNGGVNSSTVVTDDRDFNRYWSTRMTLIPTSASASMVLHINNALATPNGRLLRGIYITTNPNVTVTLDGTAVNLTVPTVMDNSAAVKGNLILNSSFELADDAGITQTRALMVDLISTVDAHSGTHCVRLPLDGSMNFPYLETRIYSLKPNKQYTFSAWVKVSNGSLSAPDVRLMAMNAYTPPPGFDPQYTLTSPFFLPNATWQRISVTGYMKAYPTADFFFSIQQFGNTPIAGQYLLIDDIQLEEGALTGYAAAANVEASISMDWATKPGNIFYSSDALNGVLTAYNPTSSAQTATLFYEIRDYLNRVVRSGSTAISLTAQQTTTTAFDLSTTGKLGSFRLTYWLGQEARSEKELAYAIIPAVASGVDLASYFGGHIDYVNRNMSIFERLGIRWNRDLHPGAIMRWETVEPTEGTFVYFNAQATTAISHNIEILANLWSQSLPAYADDGTGKPIFSKWRDYCAAMAAHYKTGSTSFPTKGVQYWEIWNEPPFTATYYAQLVKEAVDAMKPVYPAVKIVAIAGKPVDYINEVIAAWATLYPTWTWQTDILALAIHTYPQGADPTGMATLVTTYGVQAWNTESGLKTWGPLVGAYADWTSPGKPILVYQDAYRFYNEFVNSPAQIIAEMARGFASLETKFFYYSTALPNQPDFQQHEYTMLGREGAINTKGIAFAICKSFLDHATGHGNSGSGSSRFYSFTTSADPVAVLVTSDNFPRQVVLTGPTHAQLALYDMMGNAIAFTGTTIPYGRIPVYLKGVGITELTLRNALSSGVITTIADAAAPNVMIAACPRTTSYPTFRARWFAIDETSCPSFGEFDQEAMVALPPAPDAIQYQYRLNPYSAWSAWVANSYADYVNVPNGVYTFEVKARDAALNESAVVTQTVTISGGGGAALPPTIATLTPTSAIPNPVVPIVLQGVEIAGTYLNVPLAGGSAAITFSNPNVTVSGTPTSSAGLITMNVRITAGAPPNAGTVSIQTDGGTVATGFIVSPTPSGA